jgi:hypothetical protein
MHPKEATANICAGYQPVSLYSKGLTTYDSKNKKHIFEPMFMSSHYQTYEESKSTKNNCPSILNPEPR